MQAEVPLLDYRHWVPKETPFPSGKVKLIVPSEVVTLADITQQRTAAQLLPGQVRQIRQVIADNGTGSCVTPPLQPRAIPGYVFLDETGKPFSAPREGVFEMQKMQVN